MLMVISPAKTLDFESKPVTARFTQPQYLDHSQELIEQLREFSPAQISELMRRSERTVSRCNSLVSKLLVLPDRRREKWPPML